MKFYVPRLVVWLPEEVRQTNQPKHTTIFAPNNIYIFFFQKSYFIIIIFI
jgi:hypothetical protein